MNRMKIIKSFVQNNFVKLPLLSLFANCDERSHLAVAESSLCLNMWIAFVHMSVIGLLYLTDNGW